MAKTKDLTQGSVWKLLLVFAFPTLLSNNNAKSAVKTPRKAQNKAVNRGTCTDCNKRIIAQNMSCNCGIGKIIKLLKNIAQKSRKCKN